jgi:hypothetical protein
MASAAPDFESQGMPVAESAPTGVATAAQHPLAGNARRTRKRVVVSAIVLVAIGALIAANSHQGSPPPHGLAKWATAYEIPDSALLQRDASAVSALASDAQPSALMSACNRALTDTRAIELALAGRRVALLVVRSSVFGPLELQHVVRRKVLLLLDPRLTAPHE